MILNHLRQRVDDSSGRDSYSYCPLCARPLVARRGDINIWHWAHKPRTKGRSACPFEESPWHLKCKDAYSRFPGWQIEYQVLINGQRFILDAVNPSTGRVREFVHSLSPYYVAKHQLLAARFSDVRWLFDGQAFFSRRYNITKDRRGVRSFLKPRAFIAVQELHPRAGVLVAGPKPGIFNHWKDNVWYLNKNESAVKLARLMSGA